MKGSKAGLLLIVAVSLCPIFAAEHELSQRKHPAEYDKLKSLVGQWEGVSVDAGKESPAVVTFELISGGTALMEKLGPGTNYEMVSIYHPVGKNVAMTHYCMAGNQPYMRLKSSKADLYSFEMKGTQGIEKKTDMHIHSLDLKWIDEDQIEQTWTSYTGGKKSGTMLFKFKRKAHKK